jgi:hypothetical protein
MPMNPGEVQCEHCQTVFPASSAGLSLSLFCPSCCRPTSAAAVKSSVRDATMCAYCLSPRPAVQPTSFAWVDSSRGKYGAIMRAEAVPRCGSCKWAMRTISIISVLLALLVTSSLVFFDLVAFDGVRDKILCVLLLTPVLGFGLSQLALFHQRGNARQWLGVD